MRERLGNPERPGLNSDLYQHPHRHQAVGADPSDGLPRPVSPVTMEQSKAPALDLDSFVCAEDASSYVVRDIFTGEVILSVDPSLVVRAHNGTCRVPRVSLTPSQTEVWEKHKQEAGFYEALDAIVGPVRPQCLFYRRVLTDLEGDDTAKSCERSCSAQRTESGEFAALRDTRVYACEFREPRDFVSLERLREFDRKAMVKVAEQTKELDIEAALAALNNGENQNG